MARNTLLLGAGALAACALAATAASAAGTGATAQAAPKVVPCATLVYPLGTGPEVYVTSARGLTCGAAAREQRRTPWTGNRVYRTKGGYVCRAIGRGELGYQSRCVKGPRAFRIEFLD